MYPPVACQHAQHVSALQVPIIVAINGTSVNATSCAVSYALSQAGQGADTRDGNDNYLASLQLTVSNSALNAPITVPYTITVNNSAYTGVTQSVGLNLTDSTASSGIITGSVADYWNILWPAESNNVTVSMLLQGTSTSLAPDQVVHCSVSDIAVMLSLSQAWLVQTRRNDGFCSHHDASWPQQRVHGPTLGLSLQVVHSWHQHTLSAITTQLHVHHHSNYTHYDVQVLTNICPFVTVALTYARIDAVACLQVLINALSCTLTDATPKPVNAGPQPSAANSSSGAV